MQMRYLSGSVGMAGLLILLACFSPTQSGATSAAKTEKKLPHPAVEQAKKVLHSSLAGSWYPAQPEKLKTMLTDYIQKADPPPLTNICALILPHAGYRYSGHVAAYGVKLLQGHTFKRVIILGPSHRVAMPNVLSLPDATHYATILGEIPLDQAFMDALLTYPEFRRVSGVHEQEHSVQMELPLLQQVLPRFQLVPIVAGQLTPEVAKRAAEILRTLIGPETLVIASSDFTHYGPAYGYLPFRDHVAENIRKIDMDAFSFIRKKDATGFITRVHQEGYTICGRDAITILLNMLPQDAQAHLLKYDTSGAMLGDYTNSVSYIAAAFTGQWPRHSATRDPAAVSAVLSDSEKTALLELARQTIAYTLSHGYPPSEQEIPVTITKGMRQKMGAFVTLTKNGELRGCIGEIIPRRPLYQAVMAEAVNAAFHDPRFPPLRKKELAQVHIEISAYDKAPVPVKSYHDIQLGRHGIVLEKNGHRALFLPQVAVEQGWDLEETLRHLSLKANLPPDAWKEGTSFSVFEAIVFGEDEKE